MDSVVYLHIRTQIRADPRRSWLSGFMLDGASGDMLAVLKAASFHTEE
jgi:hypothetical protein